MNNRKLIQTIIFTSLVMISLNSCKKNESESIPEATISGISPMYGTRGSTVTISGENFHSSAVVTFNGIEAVIQSNDPTSLVVTVPDNATTGIVSVMQGDMETQGPSYYVYTPAKNLFFLDAGNLEINKIDLVNTPDVVITLFDASDGILNPTDVDASSGDLYVTEEFEDRILKVSKSGTGTVVVVYDATDGVNTPDAIEVDESSNTIYWANSGTDQIMSGSAGGTTVPDALYNGDAVISYCYGLEIDLMNNKLYTSDFDTYIKVGNLDGTGTHDVLWDPSDMSEMSAPSNLYIDPVRGKMYWTDESSALIVEANMDGTGTPVILFDDTDGVVRPDGIVVDYASGIIYWADTSLDILVKGNLDGSGTPEVIADNIDGCYGMDIEFQD